MAKNKQESVDLPAFLTGDYVAQDELRSFYSPHVRALYQTRTDVLVDPRTGEFKECPSMTKQSFLEECDINNIIKAFSKSGQFRHVSAKAAQGAYQDLPDDSDFQNALHTVMAGREAFASLPSKVRSRFGNDPAQFLAFLADPANQDEAIKMGLAVDKRPAPPAGDDKVAANSEKTPAKG